MKRFMVSGGLGIAGLRDFAATTSQSRTAAKSESRLWLQ
jgi:ABC-type transporter lipoprotein component MlaA